ncbi:acyltransferase family protein [Bosea lathyri]|uniref:Peptidoglycan/LPS O-acetylase OafA/YrhL, contains acyltransferase and SGNH-hydrolase domains n=1 Tax=Bosea lathyri TaxID=1036778 RepID=A0A1H6D4D3_9HYPH|nr:acyltransferase [Bosea lathyri]SEG80160.1 Peptidoglycan/LPS O-acetylase OafA/YrhL, contains acyltransferase and SGNH-hydrolase domains [Bosea lathyri]
MSSISSEPAGKAKRDSTAQGLPSLGVAHGNAAIGVRNARLQYLRGFAAVTVMLYHCSGYLEQMRGDARFLVVFSGYWGAYGVAVFFVLSGYLMSGLSARGEALRFLLDRVLRIYPLLLIVIAIAALAYLVTGFWRRPDFIALSLVPAGPRDYFLGIEWTLLFEMTYYVVIATMMLAGLRSWLQVVFAAWLGALAITSLVGSFPQTLTPTLSQLFTQSANAAFLMGFLLPALLRLRWLPPAAVLYSAAALVTGLFFILPNGDPRWFAALSSLLLLAGALTTKRPTGNGLAHRVGVRLGDSSYALYLCHVPVIVVTGNIVSTGLPSYLLWAGWATAALAAALALGSLDLRLHRKLKAWAGGLSRSRIAMLSSGFLIAFATIAIGSDVSTRQTMRAEAAARAALADATPQTWPTVVSAIDSSNVLQNGRLVVRGYGIDLASPDDDAYIAIRQGDRIIGFDRMRRMRPKIAEELKRPDLASIRFGFSVVTDGPFVCAQGPLIASLILPDGRVAPIGTDVLDAICPKGSAPPAP